MIIEYKLNELDRVAQKILAIPNLKKIITFNAPMGAGKTTLIKALIKSLNANDLGSSPTFSIINEYHTKNNEKIFHIDLYRLKSEEEAYDMGLDEYFYSDNWCFIEWPDKTPNLIPSDHANATINIKDEEIRVIEFTN